MGNKIFNHLIFLSFGAMILLCVTVPVVTTFARPTLRESASNSSSLANAISGPQITLSTSTGYVGDLIKVTGSGFKPDQYITFSIDGSAILSYITGWDSRIQVMTDTNGAFGPNTGTFSAATCSVPNLPGGIHIVTAQDESGGTATANITIMPKIIISKLQGFAGTQVTANGSGLKANSIIDISFNSTTSTIATANTDAFGAFTHNFTIPAVPNGGYDIKISDGVTTQDFSFSVQSNAPIAPSQLLPSSGTAVNWPLSVAWSYTGSFGITYELQVSTDPDFAEIVFDKTGITAQSYTIADNLNTVSGNLYYWRVRAIYLGNEAQGNWSTANTFRVSSTRSSWMAIVLSSLAVLVLVVVSFFLIRLRKRSIRL